MMELWPLWALGFSFLGALIIGFNHAFKVDGRALVVGRMIGVLPLALAFAAWLPWPTDVDFYLTAFAMGVLLAVGEILLFDAAAVHGGRLAALYIPLKTILAFVAWAAWAQAWPLGWRMLAVLACFAASAWALGHIRRTDASWRAIRAVVPVAILFALGDVVAKEVLPTPGGGLVEIGGAVSAYLLASNIGAAVVGLGGGRALLPVLSDPRALGVAAGFGAFLYLCIMVLLVTISLAPNPGYVGAITMLSAVWLALWARWRQGEANNFWACMLLVASAIGVALAGQ